MSSPETQVGQIYISNKKLSKSFVSLFSEKIAETGAEIYLLLEVALLNPAAWSEYEKIAKVLQNAMKKNFKKNNPNSFENAVAQMNDELGKVAAQGQTTWVGKLNACAAVRQDDNLCIATTGKIHAYLFRDNQFSDIADSGDSKNPLKTFENFAAGKVKKNDILIFTTHQLLNYISMERFQKMLSDFPLAQACQTVAGIIKDSADESVSFGTFILELNSVAMIQGTNTFPVVENKSVIKSITSMLADIESFFAHTLMLGKNARMPRISLNDFSAELIKQKAKETIDMQKLKELPKAKKFFLIAAAIFVCLLVINIGIAAALHYSKKNSTAVKNKIEEAQNKITEANSAYILNDDSKAMELLNAAEDQLKSIPDKSKFTDERNQVLSEVQSLQDAIGKVHTITPIESLNYSGSAKYLKSVGNQLAIITSTSIVPYNPANEAVSSEINTSAGIAQATSYNGSIYFTDEQKNVYKVDPKTGTEQRQLGSLPHNDPFSVYGSPEKAYTLDRASNQISAISLNGLGTTNYLKDSADLSSSRSLAIDGSVYVLTNDKILKFTSGRAVGMNNPGIKYGDGSIIIAGNNYIYIFNTQNKRVVILDKNGNIFGQYASEKFNEAKDLAIDEPRRTFYVLVGNKIYSYRY